MSSCYNEAFCKYCHLCARMLLNEPLCISSSRKSFTKCSTLFSVSVVCVLTRLDDWWITVQFPAEASKFSVLHIIHVHCEAHLSSHSVSTRLLPLEINQLEHEADHLLPSGAEVYEWNFMSILLYAFVACAGTILPWLDVLRSAWMIQLLVTNELERTWKEEAVA